MGQEFAEKHECEKKMSFQVSFEFREIGQNQIPGSKALRDQVAEELGTLNLKIAVAAGGRTVEEQEFTIGSGPDLYRLKRSPDTLTYFNCSGGQYLQDMFNAWKGSHPGITTGVPTGVTVQIQLFGPGGNVVPSAPEPEAETVEPEEETEEESEEEAEEESQAPRAARAAAAAASRATAAGAMEAVGGRIQTAGVQASDAGQDPLQRGVGLWTAGDYRSLKSGLADDLDLKGRVTSFHIGADAQVADGVLAGAALSYSRGAIDWQVADEKGEYKTRMKSVTPYVNWEQAGEGLSVWGALSFGKGSVSLETEAETEQTSAEARQRTAGGGFSQRIRSKGAAELSVRGDAWVTKWKVGELREDVPAMSVSASQARVALRGGWKHALEAGAERQAWMELGARYEGGADRRSGVEAGGGVRWSDPSAGLSVQGSARALVGRGDRRDWGVSGSVRYAAGAGGVGTSFSLKSSYGGIQPGGISAGMLAEREPTGREPVMRVDAELGHGVVAHGGLWTRYVGASSQAGGAGAWRTGVRLDAGGGINASFGLTRRQGGDAAPSNGAFLEMRASF
jgi:hypothetical protein